MNQFERLSHPAIAHQVLGQLVTSEDRQAGDWLDRQGRQAYLDQHIDRFWRTTELVHPQLAHLTNPKILDVGSFPYFGAALYHLRWQAEVTAIDMPAEAYWAGQAKTHRQEKIRLSILKKQFEIGRRLLNIERDELPYTDHFDAVFLTEVLEHLILEPHRVMARLHQALKPGGLLILSTPNAHYLMKLLAILKGENIGEPYHLGIGVYGRHNREYLLQELEELVTAHNYHILKSLRANFSKAYLPRLRRWKYQLVDAFTNLPGCARWREGLLVVAKKIGPTLVREPDFLFRH